jgi:CubicO group peptidase (beta-lactamase class C family)
MLRRDPGWSSSLWLASATLLAVLLLPGLASAQWAVLHGKNGHAQRSIPADVLKNLTDAAKKGLEIKSIAFAPNGGAAIVVGKDGFLATKMPDDLLKLLAEQRQKGAEFKSVAFSPNGGWIVLTANTFHALDIGEEPFKQLNDLVKQGNKLKWVAFAPNGGYVALYGKNGYYAQSIPQPLFDKINELGKKNAELKSVAFHPGGGWALFYNKSNVVTGGLPDGADKLLAELSKKGTQLKSISFLSTSLIALAEDDKESRDEVLWRMNRAEVPGLTIALVNQGKVEWVRGYGLLRAMGDAEVTAQTRFQAGSIGMPLTALAALRLVQQGKLDLDKPLNETLVSWKVPENDFTKSRPPTLRQALSHSAGFNHPALVFQSKSPSTLVELLEGKADSPPIVLESEPGTKLAFSGAGYCVVQQLLVDMAGKPFPDLMQDLVLGPLALRESTFEHPLPADWEGAAAVGHLVGQSPLPHRWDNCSPALAAAGLWTSAGDLAKVIVALSQSWQGKRDPFLPQPLVKGMLTPQIGDAGLGVTLGGVTSGKGGRAPAFWHRGKNTGYVCHVISYPAAGQGAVLLTNSDTGDRLIDELLDSLRLEFGWPD